MRNGVSRRDWLVGGFILAVMALLIVAGCGTDSGSTGAAHNHHGYDGERYETTVSHNKLPSFLKDFSRRTNDLYAEVGNYEELLRSLDCYCGCMTYDEVHDSLYRCYVASRDENGVTWTDHSTSCGICLGEFEDAIKLAKQGKSNEEIRQAIDDKYKPRGI